jgi:hypothetical protein
MCAKMDEAKTWRWMNQAKADSADTGLLVLTALASAMLGRINALFWHTVFYTLYFNCMHTPKLSI